MPICKFICFPWAAKYALPDPPSQNSQCAFCLTQVVTFWGVRNMATLGSSAAAEGGPTAFDTKLQQRLEAQVNALPDAYRTTVILHAVNGMDFAEVADLLSLTLPAVRLRYQHGLTQLNQALQQDVESLLPHTFVFGGERCDRIVEGVHARIGSGR